MVDSYSVVIPAYNAAATITEALNSILEQSIPPCEIIVVDDGSTDDTASLVENFGPAVTLLSQSNQGCGAATNAGMDRVSAPLLAFLDADDIWLPKKAEIQLRKMADASELSGLCSRAHTFKGQAAEPQLGSIIDFWSRTTLLVRSEVARKIGPMIDPPGGRGDTIDWIARGRDLGFRFEMLPETLALRRIRPGSLSYGRDLEKDKGYLYVIKRALDRKRQKNNDKSDEK
jgi:glycosyltransferase involved in cell wall biosynthesis